LTKPIGISYASGIASGREYARYGFGPLASGYCPLESVARAQFKKGQSFADIGQDTNPPVYVLVSEKAGVFQRAIEKYVKYVSRTVTIVHAGTSSAHSLSTSEK
jgi:hypothetical protein